MFQYRASIIKVVDGDTVDMRVDLGFDVGLNMRVRLAGLNTPERGQPGAKEATAYLLSMLPPRTEVLIKTDKDKREKFGRYLATIFLLGDVDSVNQHLLDSRLAVPYEGGKR